MARICKNMGTQRGNADSDDDITCADIEELEFDTTQRLQRFYFNLPRSKQLKSQSLARMHQKRIHNYVISSLDTLIESSQKVQEQNLILKMQAEQRLQQKLKPKLLDHRRFEAGDFTESRLKLPLDTFLQRMTPSFGDDIAMLEANMKTQQVGYKPRTKVIKTLIPATPSRKQEGEKNFVQEVREKLQEVNSHAMNQKIDATRIKSIRTELSDFDLINRPTHFLHQENQKLGGTQTLGQSKCGDLCDPVMVGCQSARERYNNLHSLISEESLETVKEDRHFTFSKELLESPRKGKTGKSDHIFDVDDAIKNLKKMPESKTFGIDLDPKPEPNLTPSLNDSMFELGCLRELVDITEGSGWEREKERKK